jgi:hypothetical protein
LCGVLMTCSSQGYDIELFGRVVMARLARNAFINKHMQGTLLGFDFADFRRLKPARPPKKPPVKPKKPQYELLKLKDNATGKIFPTPGQIINALAKRLKSDYFIESDIVGTVQGLFISDEAEAMALAKGFPHGQPKPGDGRPARTVYRLVVDGAKAEALARNLGLL